MRTPASRRSRRAARAAGVLLLTAAAVVPALAQPPDTVSGLRHVRVLEVHEAGLRSIAPTLVVGRDQEPDGTPAVSQHPYPPLLPAQSARLQQARTLRANGQLEPARSALLPLLAETAHHPEVVTEQARLLLARGDFAGAERLGRAERTARRDSLLVTLELAAALERLGRPREAAAVALEAWLATPPGVDWARDEFERLASADARGARDLLRRASAARPARADLLRTAALLDWRAGDRRAALEALERAERPATRGAPLRWDFAAEAAAGPAPEDSAAAAAALVALAGDSRFDATWRLNAARRAWELQGARGGQDEAAPALARALGGVPAERWGTSS
jgi:tetratricopeptide (TPR) repeat protein